MRLSQFVSLLLCAGLFIYLVSKAYEFHRPYHYHHYRNALWADKGGYYVYLPYYFQYQRKAYNFPDSVISKTGQGWSLQGDTLHTKYPLGPALMELPFYGLARLHASIDQGISANAFKEHYSLSLIWAPPFYVSLGLYLLFLALRSWLNRHWWLAALPPLAILAASSLYYYTVMEGLMSHSFSFFLFSAFTFFWLRLLAGQRAGTMPLLALTVGMIVVVRPFNVLLIPIYALALMSMSGYDLRAFRDGFKALLPWFPLVLLPIALQMLHYRFNYGTWLLYTYRGEGFDFSAP